MIKSINLNTKTIYILININIFGSYVMKFTKIVLFTVILLSIFIAGTVSASQNLTDEIQNSEIENNTLSIDDEAIEKVNTFDSEIVSLSDNTGNVLKSPRASEYIAIVNKTYMYNWQNASVLIYISPASVECKYDFYLDVYNSSNDLIFTSPEFYSTTPRYSISYTFPAYFFNPGIYTMKIRNFEDNKTLSYATLTVSGNPYYAVVSAGDYKTTYNSNAKYSIKVIEKGSGVSLKGVKLKISFSNGKTYYYTTDSKGMITFTPSLAAGRYTFTIQSNNVHLSFSLIKRSAVVNKASVKVTIKNIVEYKGFKTTLKAKVNIGSKPVKEGCVLFKINGKNYKVSVKKGVATKKLKLNKLKKYKYSARFIGNSNLKESKKYKSTVTIKKRQNVAMSFKKPVVYMGQIKKFVVKIKSNGKYVKGGKLLVKVSHVITSVKNKNGKVAVYIYGMSGDHFRTHKGVTDFYKKTVSKKVWVKYVSDSHKYKSLKVNFKATSKFKCPKCGKTTSHIHKYKHLKGYVYKIKIS